MEKEKEQAIEQANTGFCGQLIFNAARKKRRQNMEKAIEQAKTLKIIMQNTSKNQFHIHKGNEFSLIL